MYISVSDEIKELGQIFNRYGHKLYIVGGFVRDALLERVCLEHNDIDLCSAVKPDKLCKMLENTKFQVDRSNSKFGAIVITGEKRYEHTTFRRENFNLNGEHNPTGVEFITDIREDALRRDFTINAIYYSVDDGLIVDPVDGVKHLEQKLLVCPINAETSFLADSERILRMIRFSCSLMFEVEEKTLLAAYMCSKGISSLSKDRLRNNLESMLTCDKHYPYSPESNYAHSKCMIMIGQLDIWKFILPALDEIKNSTLKDEKGEEIYSHIINTLSVCEPNARLACLLHDVGKTYTKSHSKNFNFSADWSDIIIESNLGIDGLRYPKSVVEQVKRVVKALDFDKYGIELKSNVRKFIRTNYEDFDIICNLKDAIALENTKFTQKSKIAKRWKKVFDKMKQYNTPLKESQLDISGGDIIDVVPDIKLGKIKIVLNYLLDYCLSHPKCNTKSILLNLAKKKILKDPEFYLDVD